MKIPVVDLALCTMCLGCIEMCPSVFRENDATGYLEVVELDRYPKAEVDEAIKYCPVDAIAWEES